jgi:uroporphyrinogen-III synthase
VTNVAGPLSGFTIGLTSDRKREELADLLTRRGASVLLGPVLRTDFVHDNAALRAATEAVLAQPVDSVVANTGVGVRAWVQAAEAWGSHERLLGALQATQVLARGPKASGALASLAVPVAHQATGETLEELGRYLLDRGVAGRRVAVQLQGDEGLELCDVLREAGAEVVEIPVYKWELPEDTGPAVRLIEAAVGGMLDAITFTSAPAIRNLLLIADGAGLERALRVVLGKDVVAACVGPVCAAAAREHGIESPVAPSVGRLGLLVRTLTDELVARRSA